MTTKLLCSVIYSLGLAGSVWIGSQAYIVSSIEHERAETERAHYYASAAEWNASVARFEAIKASVELEAKRTTVETQIRGIVMNEYAKCRKGACK